VARDPSLLGIAALPPRRKNSPPKLDLTVVAAPHPEESKSSENDERDPDGGRARDNESDEQVLKRLRDVARELQAEEDRQGKGPHCVSDIDARRALMSAAAEISWERNEWQDRDDALKALRVSAAAVDRDERRLLNKQPPESRPPLSARPPSGRFAKDNSSVSSSSKFSGSSGCCSSCCSCSSGCCSCSCSSCCSSRDSSRRGTLDSYSGTETTGSSSSSSSAYGSRRGTLDSATTSSSDSS
jgi:hypothetical protein